ncbi:MAG: hypothetical protein Q4A32_09590 [Lachnospiraceae bacterium]|nr:hypothetical protein [Lachnospiraceae bacterium]
MKFYCLIAALVIWMVCGIGCGTTKPADDSSAGQGTVTPSATPAVSLTVTPSVSPTGGASKPKASPTAAVSPKAKESSKADSSGKKSEKKSESKSGGNSETNNEGTDANAAETANQGSSGQNPSEDAGTKVEDDGGYEVDTEDKGDNELPEVEIPDDEPAGQAGKQTEEPARNTEPESEQGNTGTDDEGIYVDESGYIVLPEIEF